MVKMAAARLVLSNERVTTLYFSFQPGGRSSPCCSPEQGAWCPAVQRKSLSQYLARPSRVLAPQTIATKSSRDEAGCAHRR